MIEREASESLMMLYGVLIFVVLLGVVAAGYLGLLLLSTRPWLHPPARRALVIAALVGIAAYVLSVAGSLVVGEILRHEPPGVGHPYRMPNQQAGRHVLYVLHGSVLLATTAFAYFLGLRRTGRGWGIALGALAAVSGYILLTLTITEFARMCMTDLTQLPHSSVIYARILECRHYKSSIRQAFTGFIGSSGRASRR